MNRHLFRAIGDSCELNIHDVPQGRLMRYADAVKTFDLDRTVWKTRFWAAMTASRTTPRCFRHRSACARALVRRYGQDAQVVFQIGGMFNGISEVKDTARTSVTFASFNTWLAYRGWPPWAPFPSDAEFQEWYDLERELYTQVDHIVCTNRYVMQSFIDDYGISPEKLHYIGYGVPFDKFPEFEKRSDSRIALFVGYDFDRKGGPTVVDAFRRVRRALPAARLRIIGPASLDQRYLGAGIEYLPKVQDRRTMLEHFKEAAFFIMPSVCEPFGLVFLEAMACKNPCIGSVRNAIPEIVSDGTSGYLIEPGDREALTERMLLLFSDAELRRRMGETAHEHVRKRFLWTQCGARLKEVFRLAGSRGRS